MASTVLIGFMGAGKSTLARELAGDGAVDTDALVERRLGKAVAKVFADDGEAAFRAAEEEVVLGALERGGVIALGGGAVTSDRVRAALATHTVVLVEVDPAVAWDRVGGGSKRPLAGDRDAFMQRFAARAPVYDSLADVFAAPRSDVRAALDLHRPGLRVLAPARGGPVVVGEGAIAVTAGPGRRFCVSDSNVADIYAGGLGEIAGLVEIPAGEEHKTLATAERVWRALAQQGMTRADCIVALGGGVVGDLAGFCAAGYQRGVPVVQVPTTLVAQVDSAYGGKTGVDLPEAKNYVGAYHQPTAVLVDPTTLETLPVPEQAAGYAEVVKTALIAGGPLWERVAAGEPVDDEIILRCARTKLAIVAADERDAGRRQVLNLGHTVGHALETVTGYARFRHGEAVGLGLLAALRLSGMDDLRGQVATLLERAGLPLTVSGVDPVEVVAATARDKKRVGARTPFVLVRAPGEVEHGCDVGEDDLLAAVRAGHHMNVRNRVLVMHGVNLDMLGRRPADHYGDLNLDRLQFHIDEFADALDLQVQFFHSNHEGEFVEKLHRVDGLADGLLLNPGAWTHYSWAIRDALEIARMPAVEVHISDVNAREEFRRTSVIRDLCIGEVSGKGADGYRDALQLLKTALEQPA